MKSDPEDTWRNGHGLLQWSTSTAGERQVRLVYVRMGLSLLSVVLISLSLASLTRANLSESIAWTGLLGTLVVPVWLDYSLRSNPFHPYSFWALKTVIFVPVGGLALFMTQPWPGVPFDHFSEACLLAGFFFVGVYAGFRASIARSLARSIPLVAFPRSEERSWKRLLISAVALYLVGWVGRIGAANIGASHLPSDLGQGFVFMSFLGPLSMFALLASTVIIWQLLHRRRKGAIGRGVWLIVLLLLGLEVVAGAMKGGRTAILMPLVIGLMVVHYTITTVSWRAVIGLLLAVIFTVVPVLTAYRIYYYEVLRDREPGLQSVQRAVHKFEGYGGLFSRPTSQRLIERFGVRFEGPLQVHAQVPNEHHFQWGQTFWPKMATAMVPRILWQDKPILSPGRDFAQTFWDKQVGEEFGTNMSITVPGELYYNFGWLGLAFAPLWGFGLRFFTERISGYKRKERYGIIRLLFVILVVTSFGHLATSISGIVRQAVWYTVFLALLYQSFPRVIVHWSR